MPGPVPADGSLAYQPGFGEFPKADANPGHVEFRHTPQLLLGQRPASHCERREHCPAGITATGDPGCQQLRQLGRKPATGAELIIRRAWRELRQLAAR